MAMRRASGRASGTGSKHTKTKRPPQPPARPQSQSSTGSNAAAAHGYTQKGPTRKLRKAPKPAAPPTRQPLRQAYQQDVKEETQKGSPAQRGATFRQQAESGARAMQQAAAQRRVLAQRDAAKSAEHGSVIRDIAKGVESVARATPVTSVAVDAVKAIGGSKPKALEKELQGQGHLAKTLKEFGEGAAKRGVVVSGGAGGGAAGALNKRSADKHGGTLLAAATPQQVKSPKLLNNAVKDVVNLPAQVLPGVVQPAEAVVAASKGDTKPAKKYLKQVTDSDPVYNAGKAAVQAASGDTKGASKSIRKAGSLAEEHPGLTALEVVGGAKAVDRAAGRVVRATGRVTGSKRVQAAGAVHTRPDAEMPGTAMSSTRAYSRGVVGKRINVASDRRGTAKAAKLRAKADVVETTDTEAADRLRERAVKADPKIMSPRQVKQYVDLHEAAGERARRRVTQERDAGVTKLIRQAGGERKGAALNLTVQGITKASVEDLRAYKAELEHAHEGLVDSTKRRANKQLRQQIDRSIKAAGRKGRIRGLDLEKIQAAAKEYHAEHDVPLDKRLADLKIVPAEQSERAKLVSGPVRRGEIEHTPEGFVDPTGEVISTPRLRQIAKEHGATPSYISQGPNARGSRNYYMASAREPVATGRARTGTAIREGAMDVHPETVRASALRRENIAQAAENYRGAIKDAAVRDRENQVRPETFTAAKRRADNMSASTGIKYTPVSFEPWSITKEHAEGMRASINEDSPKASEHLFQAIQQQLDPSNQNRSTSGSFVVVPENVARRMSEHAGVLNPNDYDKIAQAFRGAFSRTVLSVSPSPTIGNFMEAGFRTAVSRSGPVSYWTMKKTFEKMTPAEKAEFKDRVFGSGPVTLRARSRHFEPGQLNDGAVKDIARGWAALKQAPVAKQVTGAWHLWNKFITSWLNGKIEHGAQYLMAGKAIRDSGLMGESTLRLSSKAFEEAANGVKGTPAQNALAKALIRDFGKYDGFSPGQRRLIANYTPFLAWWMSAARFVGGMPVERPLLTALVAANTQVTGDAEKLAAQPDWLRGTAKVGGTQWQVSRNTPFGAFTNPVGSFGQLILPQIISPVYNSQGLDWKGDKLPDDSQEGRAKAIAMSLLGSSVPIYALPTRAIDYTKNPDKLLNPVRIRSKLGAGSVSTAAGIDDSAPSSNLPSAPTLPSGGGYRLP